MMYKCQFHYLCSMKNAFLIYLCLISCQLPIWGSNPYRWKAIDMAFDSLGIQLEMTSCKSNNRMEFYPLVNDMYQIATQKKNPNLLVRALYWDAWLQFETNTEKTEALILQALEKADSAAYSYDFARISFVKGMLLAKRNIYPEAYRVFKTQENYFKSIGDLYNLGYTYVNIGSIMRRIGEYQEGYKYYLLANEAFRKGGFDTDELKNEHNIGISQYHLGNQQKAIDILTTLLQNKITEDDATLKVDILTSLYYVSKTLTDKERYAREAYRTAQHVTNKTSQTYTLINMGAIYIYKHDNDSALFYFKKARQLAEANKDAYSAIHTLYGLSEIFDRKNEPDSAYQCLKRYLQYKEETTGHAKSNEINRLEVRAAIKQYEKELKEADMNMRKHKRITLIIIFSVTFLAIIGFYILWILRKKEKINKLLKEAENRELNERLKREKLQNEQFLMKIDLKNRELTSNSMIMAEKNQLLKELMGQIEDFASQGLLPRQQEKALNYQIKKHLGTGDEWAFFKLHFEEVHPNFFLKLSERHPVLSENDLRLCAYIRIGMTNKQIAQMLYVLPETINTSRYRIRKKLHLEQDESLEDYLRRI